MQTLALNTLSLTLFVLFLLFSSPPSAAAAAGPARDLLHSSCAQARYPTLCVQTLTNYANPAAKPVDLAQAAVKVSLARSRTLSVYLNTLNSQTTSSGLSKRQRVAVSDCVAQIADSVAELSKTLNELQHLHVATFQWQMSNAQTWASAALTDGETCVDGFDDGKLKLEVKRRVTDVGMVTSNALYLINRLGDSKSWKLRTNFNN
ncbi:pectinesterase inhibitor 3-like [Abrus precatorius]|uniref:Pectinesterase inhibitor 3-like n=1 Tax=Abrus precatorius TaxID=3816 RepID=A0A8B8MLF6_ABRPR|nr:pectinesterase inhibitor 3-like [Abrus precatorius]